MIRQTLTMYFKSLQFTVISYLNFVLILIGGVKSDVLTDLLGTVSDITNNILKGTASILQGPVARDLCDAKTVELNISIEMILFY